MSEYSDIIDADPETPEEEPNADPWHRSDDDILAQARKEYRACCDAESENRNNAKADLEFLSGGEAQWDAQAVTMRKADGRPVITVNSLPTYLHQVTNDQRMNTPSIKVHPVDDQADIETAKVRQGLIRHIEYDSNADVAYDRAVNSAAAVGFGYFRLVTDFEGATSWNQNIMFRSVRNALSVRIDPLSTEPDGSDMKYAFVEYRMSKDAFRREWPGATAATTTLAGDEYSSWITDADVLICDYYKIETRRTTIVLLSTGESGPKDELVPPDGRLPAGLTITKEREGEMSRTMLYKITGVDVLARTEIKCEWIPVFPVYGDEIDIEGKVIRAGIIRNAKGPAQMYNATMTSATEEVLMRAKAPWVMAEGQEEGYEDEWEQANVRAFPYLRYKPVGLGDKLAPPPQRNQMADVPTGLLSLAMHASDNIKKTTGLFDASLGARGTATSGKQELAQQREGDVANYHYMDGLLRTIRHCGRCINNMIPAYYDTERTVKILGEDGATSYATINKAGSLDMKAGKYDVTVTAGPSYTTARQENAEFFANALSAAKDPASAAVFSYLAIRNQDVPGGETATKMMETLLPAPAKAVIDQENAKGSQDEGDVIQTSQGPIPVKMVPTLLDEMKAQLGALNEALEKADAAKKQTELLKQQQAMREQELEPARIAADQQKTAAEIAKAEAARIQAEADLIRARSEAEAAPFKARADAEKAEADRLTAEVNYVNAQADAQIAAAKAQSEALNGDTTAFEAWKTTLESETRIRVAEIMARSRNQGKGNGNGKTV